jgi:hypothetical protein
LWRHWSLAALRLCVCLWRQMFTFTTAKGQSHNSFTAVRVEGAWTGTAVRLAPPPRVQSSLLKHFFSTASACCSLCPLVRAAPHSSHRQSSETLGACRQPSRHEARMEVLAAAPYPASTLHPPALCLRALHRPTLAHGRAPTSSPTMQLPSVAVERGRHVCLMCRRPTPLAKASCALPLGRYGPLGHGVATRAQLDRTFTEYDFIFHIGVRVGWWSSWRAPAAAAALLLLPHSSKWCTPSGVPL